MLGRKTGRGLYTYEGPDSPVVVDDDKTPSADDLPTLRHDIGVVGVVGTGTMATGIVEVFAKSGYAVTYVGRTEEKVAKVAAHDRALARQGDPARQARGVGQGRGARPADRYVTLDDLAQVDIVVEAIVEDLKVKQALFENLDEICKPGRDPGHDDLVAADHRRGAGDQPARRTSSGCTSSTRRR